MKMMPPESKSIRRVFKRVQAGKGRLPTAAGDSAKAGTPANKQLIAVGLRKAGVPPVRFKKFRRKKAA